MHTRLCTAVILVLAASAIAPVQASTLDVFSAGLIRANGQAPRNFAVINQFDAAVDAVLPSGRAAITTPLSSLVGTEGLLGGPASGAFFSGSVAALPSGITLSAVDGQPPLNSGRPGSTAVFVDRQGRQAGTPNLYYLGDPAEGATDRNRVQFAPTDVGTNADDMLVLRPVSFDCRGEAIEVQPGEKGVLEAGSFRFQLDSSLGVYGLKLTFIDTEADAALRTGVFNIRVGGLPVANTFAVPAGGNDNEYFVGFFGSDPITSFDIRLGKINASYSGGDGVVLDLSRIELIRIPEPASFALFVAIGVALMGYRRWRTPLV